MAYLGFFEPQIREGKLMTKKSTTTEPTSLNLIMSKTEKLSDGNTQVILTIPWSIVSDYYKKTLKEIGKGVEIKGFRKGKAPEDLVEKKVGKKEIYQEMLKTLLTDAYLEAVKRHQLRPIVNPKIELVSAEDGKDWEVKCITGELPEIKLGDFRKTIREEFAAEKIWVPGKSAKVKSEKKDRNQKMNLIFEILLKSSSLQIPAILVEDEVNRMLSRLLDQTSRLGLTVEQYLTSIGKTSQQIREEYRQQAEKTLKLELILAKISQEEMVTISEEEIEKMIQAVGDEKTREALRVPSQKVVIRQILVKNKTIDSLLSL